jgi:hypothetical protein
VTAVSEPVSGSPRGPRSGFGLFSSILMALLISVASFFLFTFLSILGITFYNLAGHRVDYADSYKLISFPAACVVLVISLVFFAGLWLRRKLSP